MCMCVCVCVCVCCALLKWFSNLCGGINQVLFLFLFCFTNIVFKNS